MPLRAPWGQMQGGASMKLIVQIPCHNEAEALAALSRTLVALGDQAVAVLRDAMRDSTAPINARLRAADMVLSRLLQLRELVNLDRRLSNLEARVNEEAL